MTLHAGFEGLKQDRCAAWCDINLKEHQLLTTLPNRREEASLLAAVGVDDGVSACAGAGVWQLGAEVQSGCDALVDEVELRNDLLLHIAAIAHRVQPRVNDELAVGECNSGILVKHRVISFDWKSTMATGLPGMS